MKASFSFFRRLLSQSEENESVEDSKFFSCAPCGKPDSSDERTWPLLAFKSNWQLSQFNFKINIWGVTCFVPGQTSQKQIQGIDLALEELWISLFNFLNRELFLCAAALGNAHFFFGGYGLETNVRWVLLWVYRVTESCSSIFSLCSWESKVASVLFAFVWRM